MRRIIRAFDAFLRRRLKVYEFCDYPDCVFRLRLNRLPHDLVLHGLQLSKGEPVLEVHLWNEHMPPMPSSGADLTWAIKLRRLLFKSMGYVAEEMRRDARLSQVRVVSGITVLLTMDDPSAAEEMFVRLGFTVVPYRNPLGRFGEFWENFYTWALMWTFNPGSLQNRSLVRLRRNEIWMLADEFIQHFGNGGSAVKMPAHEIVQPQEADQAT